MLLVPLAVVPAASSGLAAWRISSASVGLGAIFLGLAVSVWRLTEGREADSAARQLFQFSILYLFLLFAVLLVEHVAVRVWA